MPALYKSLYVRLILINGNKVLLLKRRNRRGGGYALAGGKVKKKELPSAALIREVKEEANIVIHRNTLKLFYIATLKNVTPARTVFYFIADTWHGISKNKEPHKFKSVAWVSIEKLPPKFREIIGRYRLASDKDTGSTT